MFKKFFTVFLVVLLSGTRAEKFFQTIYYTALNGHINGIEIKDNGTTNFGLFNVMETNPLFCSPDSNDFKLTSISPSVDYSNINGPIGANKVRRIICYQWCIFC